MRPTARRHAGPLEPAPTLKAPTVFTVDDTAPDNPYAREWKGVTLDVYRVLRIYGITDPAVQHAVKKLLRYGSGEHKDKAKDIAEAIASLQRWQAMEAGE